MSQEHSMEHTLENNHGHFKQYGKSFQEKIFQGLLHDHVWAAQMIEVMSPAFFELKYLHYLTEKYFKYQPDDPFEVISYLNSPFKVSIALLRIRNK